MRQLTDSERKTFDLAWLECLGNRRERGNDLDFFESGFISALDYADQQIAALAAERTQLRAELDALLNLINEAYEKLGGGHHPYASGVRDALGYVLRGKDEARRALDKFDSPPDNQINSTTTGESK